MDLKQVTYELSMSFLNKPYLYGGKTPISGMDCSGLVCELLQSLDKLKNNEELNAAGIYAKFIKEAAEVSLPIFGSLLFFGQNTHTITHVAFGLNGLQMLEAGGGTSSTKTAILAEAAQAFVKIRPYTHRQDLVAILNPTYGWE